jgi:hypothetical protein
MGEFGRGLWADVARVAQATAQGLLVLAALGLAAATAAAALGAMPWPELAVQWGGEALPLAGMALQVGLTALLLLLAVFLPANARMVRLERSHRSFRVGLDDVRRAYELAHAADRRGVFSLSSEFETLRARMEHLKRHPDLREMEPELLELAAQMSFAARDLARTYAEDRVARARGFLAQRQEEAALLSDRIKLARATCAELRKWLTDVEAEERRNHVQIRRLEADLREVLPAIGYELDEVREPNVVPLAVTQKA